MELVAWPGGDGKYSSMPAHPCAFPKDQEMQHTKHQPIRIFILEGIVTVFISSLIWALLPDDPSTARFLTPDERAFVIARLEHDTGSGRGRVTNDDKINRRQILAGLTDWKIWLAVVSVSVFPTSTCQRAQRIHTPMVTAIIIVVQLN